MIKIYKDGEWKTIGGKSQYELYVSKRSEFPDEGKMGVLYVSTDENRIYRYDEVEHYVLLGQTQSESVSSVNGKNGDVVLDATDIKLTTNRQSIQNNIIRIDEELNRIEDEIPTISISGNVITINGVDYEIEGDVDKEYVDSGLSFKQNKVVIESSSDIVVGGISVPSLTVSQVGDAYNSIVAGNLVVISSNDGTKHFTPVVADSLSDMPSIQFIYYNLVITYWIENNTVHNSYLEIGGGGQPAGTPKYAHFVCLEIYGTSFNQIFMLITEDANAYANIGQVASWLYNNGYRDYTNYFSSTTSKIIRPASNKLSFLSDIYSPTGTSISGNTLELTFTTDGTNVSIGGSYLNKTLSFISDKVVPLQ